MISGDAGETEETRKKLTILMHNLIKLKFLWKGQDAQTKLRIFIACVFSFAIGTYGCEARIFGWKKHLEKDQCI